MYVYGNTENIQLIHVCYMSNMPQMLIIDEHKRQVRLQEIFVLTEAYIILLLLFAYMICSASTMELWITRTNANDVLMFTTGTLLLPFYHSGIYHIADCIVMMMMMVLR